MIFDQFMPQSYRSNGHLATVKTVRASDIVEFMRSEFGQRLYLARTAKGLSQHAAAKAAGMTQSNYGELEKKGMGSTRLADLAAALDVNAAWLASGTGPMSGPVSQKAPESDRRLASRREFMLADIGDMLERFESPDQLRTVYARVLAVIDAYTAELATPSSESDQKIPRPAAAPIAKPKSGQ